MRNHRDTKARVSTAALIIAVWVGSGRSPCWVGARWRRLPADCRGDRLAKPVEPWPLTHPGLRSAGEYVRGPYRLGFGGMVFAADVVPTGNKFFNWIG